jgi:hypothetical protein
MASYIKASLERSYAESFLLELERNENQYFLFVAKGTTWENGENSPSSYTDTVASENVVMNNIIGYKKLNPENVLFALPKIPWGSGTVYDQYDDAVDLFSENDPKRFYVVTDENHIYKCLFNGGGVPSTQKPNLVITSPFFTSDGYQWKYLATARESDLPYELSDYIPIDFSTSSVDTETQNQFNTQTTAVNGSITRIETANAAGASAGKYPYAVYRGMYENMGQYVLRVQEITPTSDPTVKRVRVVEEDSATTARLLKTDTQSNYIGHILRIEKNTDYPVDINNYGVIVDFSIPAGASGVSASREIIFTVKNDAIDFTATIGSGQGGQPSAEILPYIKIVGDGSGAYAFPRMKSTPSPSGSGIESTIESVEVIAEGRDYTAVRVTASATLQAGTVHPTLRAVVSPKGGHGSNILKELNVKEIIIVVDINEEDSDSIVVGGTYRQFGIIRNPLLSGSRLLAGTESKSFRNLVLIFPGKTAVAGDFDLRETCAVIGQETFASARIVSVVSTDGERITVKGENSYGRFVTRQDRQNDYILTLETQNGYLFFDGETVFQTVPAGTVIGETSYGYITEVRGLVLSRDEQSLTVRVTSSGNFVFGQPIYSSASGQAATVVEVTPTFGERVWVTLSNPARFSQSNPYKIYEVGLPYFDRDRVPVYSGLHALELVTSVSGATGAADTTSSPLTQTAFTEGQLIEQGVSAGFGNYARGVVYRWEYVNPARGILYLTDVLGLFRAVDTDGTQGSVIGNYTLSSVTPPEIDRTSGEVVYIDSIRAIRRVAGQQEEFRIRLGF